MIKLISWNPILQVMGIFFIQPVVFGVWLALIPEVQSGLNLDKSQLAIGLMGTPTGMLLTLPFAGKVANNFGIRNLNILKSYFCTHEIIVQYTYIYIQFLLWYILLTLTRQECCLYIRSWCTCACWLIH